MEATWIERLCYGGPKDGQMIRLPEYARTWAFPLDAAETLSFVEYEVCRNGHLHYVEPFDG